MKRILLALLVAICLFAFTACGSTVDLSSVESKLDQLQDRIAELETENGKLKTDVADMQDQISGLETENGKLQTDITDLYNENGKLKTDIEELISSGSNGLFDWDNPLEVTVAEICAFGTNEDIAKHFFGKVVHITGNISEVSTIRPTGERYYSSVFVDINDSEKMINLYSTLSLSDYINETVVVECIFLGGGQYGAYTKGFDFATIIEVLD